MEALQVGTEKMSQCDALNVSLLLLRHEAGLVFPVEAITSFESRELVSLAREGGKM